MERRHSVTGLEVFHETGNQLGGRVTDAWISYRGWQSGERALHKKKESRHKYGLHNLQMTQGSCK